MLFVTIESVIKVSLLRDCTENILGEVLSHV